MPDAMTAHLSTDGVFTTDRLIPFSPEQAFAAFSDPQRLARW